MNTTIGPYEVLHELDSDGARAVYQARDDHGVELRLEWFRAHADAALHERFQARVRQVARLEHPGLYPVRAGGDHHGRPFLSLPDLEGDPLPSRLERQGPLPEEAAARALLHLAEALQAAHDRGLVHGHLRPSDVFVAADGAYRIKGLALTPLRAASDASAGEVEGEEAAYLAPETAGGDPESVGPGTDVYGLGALFYALLTGDPPFVGSDVREVLDEVVIARPTPPSQRVPAGLERAVDSVCLKCLEKYPQQRYASCAELADALRDLLGEAQGTAPSRAPVFLAGGLLAAGLVAAGAIVVQRAPAPTRASPTPAPDVSASASPAPESSPSSPAPTPEPPSTSPSPRADAASLADASWQRARDHARHERWPQALDALEEALTHDPEHAEAHAARVWVLDALGARPGPVAAALEGALERLPTDDERRLLFQGLEIQRSHEALRERFLQLVQVPDARADLGQALLAIAELGNPDLDHATTLERLEAWASELRSAVPQQAAPEELLRVVGAFLAARSPSATRSEARALYLDEALAGGPCYPILHAGLCLALARRAGLQLQVWSLPGTVVVSDAGGQRYLHSTTGQVLTVEQLPQLHRATDRSRRWKPELLQRMDRASILLRVLGNLYGLYKGQDDTLRLLGAIELIMNLAPANDRLPLRADRGTLLARLGLHRRAAADLAFVVRTSRARGIPVERLEEQLQQ
jgi:serine/threonine protein kinase